MKVLHFVSNIRISNGIMNVIMNYYRNIDRNKIQFDFLYFDEFDTKTFRDEIISLGGKVYKVNRPILSLSYRREIYNFFAQKKGEYKVLHIHEVFLAPLLISPAKKNDVLVSVIHVHSTKFGETKNQHLEIGCYVFCQRRYVITRWHALKKRQSNISEKKRLSKRYCLIHNAIDVDKYKYSKEKRKNIENCLD